jgi:hypothetical protein
MGVNHNLWKLFSLLETIQKLIYISYGINQQDDSASYHCISECVQHQNHLSVGPALLHRAQAIQQHCVYALCINELNLLGSFNDSDLVLVRIGSLRAELSPRKAKSYSFLEEL